MLQNQQHFAQNNVQGRTASFQAASEGRASSATTPAPCNSSALHPACVAMPNLCFALTYSTHQWCLAGMGKGEDKDPSAASCFAFFPSFHLFFPPLGTFCQASRHASMVHLFLLCSRSDVQDQNHSIPLLSSPAAGGSETPGSQSEGQQQALCPWRGLTHGVRHPGGGHLSVLLKPEGISLAAGLIC